MLVIILFIYVMYTAYSIWSFGQKTNLVQADAAIVLGAGIVNGEPSPVLKGRIDHAIKLYDTGNVKKLIFTGGSGGEGEISEAEAAQAYALRHGVKTEDILTETTSTITEENLYNAKIVAERERITSFIIVSDPLHMKRAMVMADDLNLVAYSSPAVNSAYKSWSTKLPFLLREVFFYIGYQAVSPFR
ncbi:YdcF family protein [Paenibacillus sp. N3/727]|uniref:YdcF family protein n=1 Tax=Paenibacillus sp. N3/727 TaxID=2925845 RepID=UPI001F52E10C|nr:YdcF family protein [Paenibacillus sp. N3/727]UNK21343.1 YdcF family protein [Paenibacillus sp. N3/727]